MDVLTLSFLAPILIYTFSVSVTPGPNNLMVTASGVNFGYWRTLPHITGIFVGFFTLNILVAAGIGAVLLAIPQLHWALKIAGSAYLLWLAWNIATAGGLGKTADGEAKPMRWWQAALFQVINPKAWAMALTGIAAFSLSGDDYWPSALAVASMFALVTYPSCSLWALLGMQLRRALQDERKRRWFNGVLGALTALSVVFILL
ncbi:LysE family translocator [Saccharospirillum sp. HFRX-1]|uniref:LysE family translocator n=1 Tax=unclassified Saccharospirillum TaxID=2633430 RepID=UPI00371563C7